jgi:hypothetical protein
MPVLTGIEPKTSALLAITVKSGGAPDTGATVTATIFNPNEEPIASNVSCSHVGSGVYNFTVLPAYSTGASQEAIEGVYIVEVKVIGTSTKQRVRRFTFPIIY